MGFYIESIEGSFLEMKEKFVFVRTTNPSLFTSKTCAHIFCWNRHSYSHTIPPISLHSGETTPGQLHMRSHDQPFNTLLMSGQIIRGQGFLNWHIPNS